MVAEPWSHSVSNYIAYYGTDATQGSHGPLKLQLICLLFVCLKMSIQVAIRVTDRGAGEIRKDKD